MRLVASEKMPIYSATKSLDVRYKFEYCILEDTSVEVPATDIHAILYAGCRGLLNTRSEMKNSNGKPTYKKSGKFDTTNFATSAMTLLYTDTTQEEGYLGEEVQQETFFLKTNAQNRIVSSIDCYEKKEKQTGIKKGARDKYFNKLLFERINTFSAISSYFHLPLGTATSETLSQKISSEMFHEDFHHSEQCLMHFLSSLPGIKTLISMAESVKAAYMYGIVLDIYTQRMLCCNCNAGLLGLQNSHEQGFLFQLGQALEEKRIQPRINNLMLSVRVSASKAPRGVTLDPLKLPNDEKQTHTYDADDLPIVLQAQNKSLGTKKLIQDKSYALNTYVGSFFASSKLSNNKLEKVIALLPKSP